MDRLALYLFDGPEPLMAAYLARLEALDVPTRSGDCFSGNGETAYVPGDDGPNVVAEREACRTDASGLATYLVTMPAQVLAEVTKANGDAAGLARWSWSGNEDVPGNPTLWRSGGPASPEE